MHLICYTNYVNEITIARRILDGDVVKKVVSQINIMTLRPRTMTKT